MCYLDLYIGFLVNVGEKDSNSFAGRDTLRMHWTLSMDRYLIDLLLEQALRGNKIGSAFLNEAWTEIAELLSTHFGSHFGLDAVKNRSRQLRKQYHDISFLLEQSGFLWDDIQESVIAENYVWDSYTKVKCCKYFCAFEELCFFIAANNLISIICRYILMCSSIEANRCQTIINYVLYMVKKVLMVDLSFWLTV